MSFQKGNHTKSEFKKGHNVSQEWIEKARKANTGKKRSEKVRQNQQKLSKAMWVKRDEKQRKIIAKKISKALKGKPKTKEHREKNRQAKLKNPTRYWLGKKFSEEYRKKLSDAQKKLVKQGTHPLWRGGISFEPYTVDWTETLKKAIRERDKYICQICNLYGNICHHIDYDKKNQSSNNLITLCQRCHSKTNHNRKYWKNILSIS